MRNAELSLPNGPIFQLEEFEVGGQYFNFIFKGTDGDNEYDDYVTKYCLFYASGDEIELVKNFLTTIRS